MSVFMTEDKKELIVTCKCHCEQGFHIIVDKEDDDYYGFLCFMKGNFYTESNIHPWRAFCIKMKKIWSILMGWDYCYSDTVMSKEDFEEFKKYINQF